MLIIFEKYCYLTKCLYICRNLNLMKQIEREVKCPECNGLGHYQSTYPVCDKPASMCCGGCYSTVDCEDCDGRGIITQTGTEYTEQEMIESEGWIESLIEWNPINK